MLSNYEETKEQALSKAKEFREAQVNGINSKVISTAKKLIFENTQGDEFNAEKPGNLAVITAAVKYIVEEVMGLTPEEYDALYSTTLNQKAAISHAIRKIVNNAPTSVITGALFDNKAILFKMCWSDYYDKKYKKPTAMDIFNATGEVKGNLVRAGRVKELPSDNMERRILQNGKFSSAVQERKRAYNHGAEVDKVLYWAMSNILPLFEMKTSELFLTLAKPRLAGWSRYGFVKVIEARECYPTPLDFYMWNSPVEYQMEHFEEYITAREKAKVPHLEALDNICKAYTEWKKERNQKEESDYGR